MKRVKTINRVLKAKETAMKQARVLVNKNLNHKRIFCPRKRIPKPTKPKRNPLQRTRAMRKPRMLPKIVKKRARPSLLQLKKARLATRRKMMHPQPKPPRRPLPAMPPPVGMQTMMLLVRKLSMTRSKTLQIAD